MKAMNKKSAKRILLFFVLSVCLVLFLLWIDLVRDTGDRNVNGIYVSESLIIVAQEQNVDYCKLLNKAIEGNDDAIKQLALLKIYDGAGYDHSAVIVDLIKLIGENKFIYSLTSINNEKKKWIKKDIEAGLEYSNNPELQTLTFKEAFPKIYEFLN
jgi:hypothetical protein